ncbi:MAG: methylenetetrahydrofolate reductase C-terminal domain-containing protein [Spirochaetes bacterium]|nr:methylenetetrahydrofolate reductase C-terminal domain-containing protein [Spirochaetota bacterium]
MEFPVKRLLFHCQNCGSCLLSQTRMKCPMNCPKGLRNGPCGGTLGGLCEVYADRACVWMEIQKESACVAAAPIHAPFDPSLLGSSSYLNLATKADAPTRLPLPFPELPSKPHALPPVTASRLERRLLSGDLVLTAEVCSPRSAADFGRVDREVAALIPHLDAFNATSNQGGVETVSSFETALRIKHWGGEPILQICARDVDPSRFLDEVARAHENGIINILSLTGDWPVSKVRAPVSVKETHGRVFRMDSSQMIYELQALRATGRSAFVPGRRLPGASPFIGGVINPYSTPRHVALSRLAQKEACGMEFVQTQVVTDADAYIDWVRELEEHGLRDRIHLIPSIPVITKKKPLEIMAHLKGVSLPPDLFAQLEAASDLEATGMEFARRLIRRLVETRTAEGFHLTRFGAKNEQLIELASYARSLAEKNKTVPSKNPILEGAR